MIIRMIMIILENLFNERSISNVILPPLSEYFPLPVLPPSLPPSLLSNNTNNANNANNAMNIDINTNSQILPQNVPNINRIDFLVISMSII